MHDRPVVAVDLLQRRLMARHQLHTGLAAFSLEPFHEPFETLPARRSRSDVCDPPEVLVPLEQPHVVARRRGDVRHTRGQRARRL